MALYVWVQVLHLSSYSLGVGHWTFYLRGEVQIFLRAIYIVSIFLILSGIMVISAINTIYSVLWLIAGFFSAVVLFILLGVEFIALIFLIVYIGAIAILFLFVIMMLNLMDIKGLLDMSNYMPAGLIITMMVFFEVLVFSNWGLSNLLGGKSVFRWDLIENISNIRVLGEVLYTSYAFLFILASFILLVAMLGAIVLTFNVEGEIKRQESFLQISR